MAAGIGSRFGGGIKQLEPVGLHNEIIMDYSIHDAIEAGFNKIIFVIRKDIEADFRERIGSRVESICKKLNVEIAYASQVFFARPFWKKMQNFLENSASPNWRKLQRYRSAIFYRPDTSAGIVNCYKV